MANEKLKVAKAQHKEALKNKEQYILDRNDIVRQMIDSRTPNWGGIKLTLINW